MADAVTAQILVDGARNTVMLFTNISDGTGESAVLKVDVSTLSGAPTEVRVKRITYCVTGMVLEMLWDADVDVVFQALQGDGVIDGEPYGGISNNAGTGVTGDIRFTTLGHSSGDVYTVVLEMVKTQF